MGGRGRLFPLAYRGGQALHRGLLSGENRRVGQTLGVRKSQAGVGRFVGCWWC